MHLDRLELTHFRCFSKQILTLSPHFNVFVGKNGSGKTAILEAIYYLGFGKSFRTHLIRRVIQRDQSHFSVFGKVELTPQEGDPLQQHLSLGIQQDTTGETCIRLNGETMASRADLLGLLPIQLINTESYRLIDSGPIPRREFVDWGVFHVKPAFLPLWRRLRHNLKQRNAALKQRLRSHIPSWDHELAELGETLAVLRQDYCDHYFQTLKPFLERLLPNIPLSFRYYRGWSADSDLKTALEAHLDRDLALGYTTVGPHRGDLHCHAYGVPAEGVLSRGQQKLLVIAMRLAQGLFLRETAGKGVIYLLDDMAAELDAANRSFVLEVLASLKSQVLLTAIDRQDVGEAISMTEIFLNEVHLVPRET